MRCARARALVIPISRQPGRCRPETLRFRTRRALACFFRVRLALAGQGRQFLSPPPYPGGRIDAVINPSRLPEGAHAKNGGNLHFNGRSRGGRWLLRLLRLAG